MNAAILERHARKTVIDAMAYARVTVLNGPRQSGKTTLATSICEQKTGTYLSLDENLLLAAARNDPVGLIQTAEPVVIDEIQRAGEPLVLAIKTSVDRDPRPGRFLLTGSTRFLTVPTISESLAGRADIVDLWPLACGEQRRVEDHLVDALFSEGGEIRGFLEGADPIDRRRYFEIACQGGFPAVRDLSASQRGRWFDSYLRTVLAREVTDLAAIRGAEELPRLTRLLAAWTAQELNVSALAQSAGMRWNTIADYLSLLETAYLFFRVGAWSRNLTAKEAKHPKVHFVDPGLCARLLGATPSKLMSPVDPLTGPLIETLVVSELARQITWANVDARLFHFRDRGGSEIDLILESADGRVAAVEVKAGASIGNDDIRTLRMLRDRLGKDFVNGVILYMGPSTAPLGDRLWAAPVSALWSS